MISAANRNNQVCGTEMSETLEVTSSQIIGCNDDLMNNGCIDIALAATTMSNGRSRIPGKISKLH